MKSPSFAALAALAAAFPLGCGTTGEDPASAVGTSRAGIVDGTVDSSTTGAVGLAIDFPGHFFGHCSGTLIAPNLVLTARHCVSLLSGSTADQVVCGVTQFQSPGVGNDFLASPDTVRPTDPSDPGFFRGIQVQVPPGTRDFCGQDVALIVLAGEGMPPSMATPVVPRIDLPPVPGEPFTTEGFGLTAPDTTNTDGTRMRGEGNTVRCVGLDCQTLQDTIHSTEWLSENARTCPGDSGGPALDAQGRVIGVTSRGPNGCTSTVYGTVSAWKDFIISVAIDAAKRGGYEAPFWTSGSSTPSAATSDDAGSAPAGSPLGRSCTGGCGAGYACYSDTGKPPGQCVPRCGADGGACPSGYACAESIDACVPENSSVLRSKGPGGCEIAHARTTGGGVIALGMYAGAAILSRRRRRRRRARSVV